MRQAVEQVELPVTLRAGTGKRAARRLRAEGQVPGVVYGRGAEPLPVAVEARAFVASVLHSGHGHGLVGLRFLGKEGLRSTPLVMVKQVQRDPITDQLLNVDFQRISPREKVETSVPLVLVGESRAVHQGALLEHLVHEVQVHCLPADIPEYLELDISGLAVGSAVHVGELAAPAGVEITSPAEEVVLLVAPPPKPPEEVAAEAPPEPEEPEVLGQRYAREETGSGARQ